MKNEELRDVWPEWQIVKRVGSGTYGVVYEAVRTDYSVESHAAIKVISVPTDTSEIDSLRSEGLDMAGTRTYFKAIVDDFVREIQLMQSMKGLQNIVSVEDYKVVENNEGIGWKIYIRMELLTSFFDHTADKKLSEEDIIKLGCDICTALEVCEKRNIIHRDIKPGNIMVNDFGDYKLGDFGIARKLEHATGGLSQNRGTPNYMAPEVFHGNDYDSRADIYSLGIVLYQLLNGNRLPFLDTKKQLLNPSDRVEAFQRRMDGEPLPAPCDASSAMAAVILCASNPDPSKRFASARAMKKALISIANGTHIVSEAGLSKTKSVRRAAQTQDPNRTTSVRRAPQEQNAVPKKVDTFGGKKKSKTPTIIAAILAVVLLVGGGAFVVPRLLGNNDSKESSSVERPANVETAENDSGDSTADGKNGVYSDFDEEQIASTIEEAEALAADEDYEGALTKIKTALVTYPKSETLQAKETEYTDALAAQVKAKTLEEAASLAESGDYVAAISLIKSAQETYGDDADYTTAYEEYKEAYKESIIENADRLADSGDYTGANLQIKTAQSVIGEDRDLNVKMQEYEELAESISHPGPWDLTSDTVTVPDDQSWVPDYSERIALPKDGHYIYIRFAPYTSSEYFDIAYEGETLLLLAEQNGFSLVKTSLGSVGWVLSDRLSGEPLREVDLMEDSTSHPNTPGIWDLTNSYVTAPSEYNWLPGYESAIASPIQGDHIYLRLEPDTDVGHFASVSEGQRVTVLARQYEFSLIRTALREVGWVLTSRLKDMY